MQHPREAGGQLLDGVHVVAVGCELQLQGEAAAHLTERNGQVELRTGQAVLDEAGATGAEGNLHVHRSTVLE